MVLNDHVGDRRGQEAWHESQGIAEAWALSIRRDQLENIPRCLTADVAWAYILIVTFSRVHKRRQDQENTEMVKQAV